MSKRRRTRKNLINVISKNKFKIKKGHKNCKKCSSKIYVRKTKKKINSGSKKIYGSSTKYNIKNYYRVHGRRKHKKFM